MKQARILGVTVAAADTDEVVKAVIGDAAHGRWGYVCVGNAHQYVLARTEPAFARILAGSRFNTFDSQVVAKALRLKGMARVTVLRGVDLTLLLSAEAQAQGLKVGFFGASAATVELLRARLARDYPALQLVFAEAPGRITYEDMALDETLCRRIATAGVQILLVGLGCPKQEKWMAVHRQALPCVQLGVGAAFDFIAGTVPPSPAWVHRAGLEWAYRLIREPRRLWRRYLVTNTLFIWYLLRELS
ncbi:MAG TPA: WecB/TagA/CpsF family glycosyltransferase [Burkholderiaceae bacterium]|jgi:N-acetylglucosaminyldiphosphoundecaprenol N-acetyl-beta-D-mannosaminyltransferase